MPFDPNNLMQDRITDIGPPKYDKFFPPVVKENYGKWKYHEILEPGVLVHVAESGAELYSVRIGTARLISVDLIREICDLADKYCGGYLRWTTRNNVEFLVSDKTKLEPLKQELKSRGNWFPVGGTGNSITNIVHTRAGLTATPPPSTPRAWSNPSWTTCSSISVPTSSPHRYASPWRAA